MELDNYFKSFLEQDPMAIVLCNLKHEILYMNPAAMRRYAKRGGAALLGKNLLMCHSEESIQKIYSVLSWFTKSTRNNRVFCYHNGKDNFDAYMIALRDEIGTLIGYYEKHEDRTPEKTVPYDLVE